MGFPCQDISHANHAPVGIDGVRSGSIMHVIKLVRTLPFVRLIFLENSPAIRMRGLDTLTTELKKSGFNLCWGLFAACDVGSPQTRLRWFGLAFRTGKDIDGMRMPLTKRPWKLEPHVDRVIPRSDIIYNRLQLLGNAVVPQCARLAFSTLCSEWKQGTVKRDPKCKLPKIKMTYPTGDTVILAKIKNGTVTPAIDHSSPLW